MASGFCEHSLRGVTIPKLVTPAGIRPESNLSEWIPGHRKPVQGHLLGDYPLSPISDRFCEGKIIRVTVLTDLTGSGQHGVCSAPLANTPAKTDKTPTLGASHTLLAVLSVLPRMSGRRHGQGGQLGLLILAPTVSLKSHGSADRNRRAPVYDHAFV